MSARYEDYSSLPEEAKRKKALADIRSFVGEERWLKLATHKDEWFPTPESVRGTFSIMLEIEGYPVDVWMQEFTPELWVQEQLADVAPEALVNVVNLATERRRRRLPSAPPRG